VGQESRSHLADRLFWLNVSSLHSSYQFQLCHLHLGERVYFKKLDIDAGCQWGCLHMASDLPRASVHLYSPAQQANHYWHLAARVSWQVKGVHLRHSQSFLNLVLGVTSAIYINNEQ
jgi:hypothetical protein